MTEVETCLSENRLALFLRLIESGDWMELREAWSGAVGPFAFLGRGPGRASDQSAGCPSMCRHLDYTSDLSEELHSELLRDPLIVNMTKLCGFSDGDGSVERQLEEDGEAILRRFARYVDACPTSTGGRYFTNARRFSGEEA